MARTDVQLMLDVKAGDEQSFELLLRKYRTPLVNFLYRMVRDSAVCGRSGAGSFSPRLSRSQGIRSQREVHHLDVPHRHESGAELGARQPSSPDGNFRSIRRWRRSKKSSAPWKLPDRAPSIEQQLVARTRSEMILRAIHALPEKQRAAVLLHKYQELDYDEIARILECSESALKSLLFRAYETLRTELAPLVSSVRV